MSHILEAANGGEVTKTKIMYKAFLSYGQLKEYLGLLIQNGLMTNDIPGLYKTTNKGLKFLDTTHKMHEMFQIISPENTLVSPAKAL